jgi:hypothetical protein
MAARVFAWEAIFLLQEAKMGDWNGSQQGGWQRPIRAGRGMIWSEATLRVMPRGTTRKFLQAFQAGV